MTIDVSGRPAPRRELEDTRVTAVCVFAVGVAAVILLLSSTSGRGQRMDEGAVVAYGARVLEGDIPHKDFLTFYGPANPWIVASAFGLFGASVTTERAVGLLYRLVLVLSLFALGRTLGGLVGAVLAGFVSAAMMTTEVIWANAAYGAIAFAVLGIALGAIGAGSSARARRHALFLLAGAASGMAVLERFDIAPAVVLAAVPMLAFMPWRARLWCVAGFGAVAGIYVPHLAIVGPERVSRLFGDLRASLPTRSLPIPSLSSHPGNVLAVALLVTVFFAALGAILWRLDGRSLRPRVLVSVGLFEAALLPWVFSRPDSYHVRPFALVSLSLLPAVILLLTRSLGLSVRARAAVAATLVGFSIVAVLNVGADSLREVRQYNDWYRGFFEGPDDPARPVVARAEQLARPGDSLFVGPMDLRRTNYGPTYMYFLLPKLQPASYYMEMNPMTANREGSGLADELRDADWLILTTKWDDWNEPNESAKLGPSEPNEVVRDAFCLRFESGEYRLYERCDRA